MFLFFLLKESIIKREKMEKYYTKINSHVFKLVTCTFIFTKIPSISIANIWDLSQKRKSLCKHARWCKIAMFILYEVYIYLKKILL